MTENQTGQNTEKKTEKKTVKLRKITLPELKAFLKKNKKIVMICVAILIIAAAWIFAVSRDMNEYLVGNYVSEEYDMYFDFQASGTVFMKFKSTQTEYYTGEYERIRGKYVLTFVIDDEETAYTVERYNKRLLVNGEELENATFIKQSGL